MEEKMLEERMLEETMPESGSGQGSFPRQR